MKCRLPPKKPTEEQEERTKRRMIRDNNKIFAFADMLLCMSMHENAGFGTSRLNHYNNNGADILEMYIKRYTVEGEPDEDYAVNGYYAMVRDLTGYGWDPEKHLWKDDVFASFPPDKNSASARKEHSGRLVYAQGISFYVREMLCATALYLREEHGFAEIRLNRVLRPVVDAYLDAMRDYMRCSPEGLRSLKDKFKATEKKYEDMGLFLKPGTKTNRKEG